MDQLSPEVAHYLFRQCVDSNVTKTIHRTLYPALSPSRPENRQDGRVILVTGGATNIGFAISQAFVRANASTVILVGRRSDVLKDAKARLEQEAQSLGTNTKIMTSSTDVVDTAQTEKFWKYLSDEGISVDVFVSNATKFSEPKPMLEAGADAVWSHVEVDAKAPIYWLDKFYRQGGDGQKFVVNVSSQGVHMTNHPGMSILPAYCMSKMFGTLFFQNTALGIPAEKMQIVSFHPGSIWTKEWESINDALKPEDFDDVQRTGAFAVWLASKQAAFLHGRYVWSSWDVDELSTGDVRKRIDEDFHFLKCSIVGLNSGMLA
ncbi:hypothetical protein GGR57DRAFT_114259 [Xylariaceae sp. FL1272]|nr:hypothetical protein GGR57DRAFT_114259 [Xylariaceae sp. FL1272]